jgi:hypothetical protein
MIPAASSACRSALSATRRSKISASSSAFRGALSRSRAVFVFQFEVVARSFVASIAILPQRLPLLARPLPHVASVRLTFHRRNPSPRLKRSAYIRNPQTKPRSHRSSIISSCRCGADRTGPGCGYSVVVSASYFSRSRSYSARSSSSRLAPTLAATASLFSLHSSAIAST